ncbi:hypothetical protein [Helicobacter gastrocanis]|uniref:hypothetical protein n=1 Tax=Helicobacter gastrocanis TaxID=2849641 RepID=UPI001C86439E|nr:hypothetical protein [Helicobacter sp. NHP19-003]
MEESKAQEWGFKHPTDVKRTIDKSEIVHVLERHGVNGTRRMPANNPPLRKQTSPNTPNTPMKPM